MKFDFKGRGRMIFALLGGIVFIVLQAVFPQLPFSEEQTLLFFGLIAAYILGEGIGGAVINDNLKTVLMSQKFQALVVGLFVALLKGFFPNLAIPDETLVAAAGALMAFIIGAGATKRAAITEG
jgi:hypothetical protein